MRQQQAVRLMHDMVGTRRFEVRHLARHSAEIADLLNLPNNNLIARHSAIGKWLTERHEQNLDTGQITLRFRVIRFADQSLPRTYQFTVVDYFTPETTRRCSHNHSYGRRRPYGGFRGRTMPLWADPDTRIDCASNLMVPGHREVT